MNVDGYIGESTRNELEYAKKLGKKIRFLHPELVTGSDVLVINLNIPKAAQ